MRLYKRGEVWWGTYYENGDRVRRSTNCHDKKAAEALVRQWERDAADPDHAAANATTVEAALAMMVAERDERARSGRGSAETVRFYRQKAGHLIRVLGGTTPLAKLLPPAGARVVDAFISTRRAEGAHETTIAKELVTLRTALKLARRRGLWMADPAAVLPIGFAPEYKPRERWLAPEELQKLLAKLTPDHAARVAFIVATSACWGETERARREDVAPDKSSVFIRGTKRATRLRSVPVAAEFQRELLDYALKYAEGMDGNLFSPWGKVNRDLRLGCTKASIDRCSPNDLRRTHATWMRMAGVPLDLIAPVMGHKDSRMLERVYARLPLADLRSRIRAALGAMAAKDCDTGVSNAVENRGFGGRGGQTATSQVSEFSGGMAPWAGLEPATRGLTVRCSAN